MKLAVGVLATAALGLAVLVPSRAAGPASSGSTAQADLAGPPRVQTQYGHIKTLTRKGGRYELRFDPAFWLGGATAQRAAVGTASSGPASRCPTTTTSARRDIAC